MTRLALTGATVFDGTRMHPDAVLVLDGPRIEALRSDVPQGVAAHPLPGGVLAPGCIDLQVNGGGGVMVGPATDAAQLARICAAHARLGATGIMPTLITDRPEVTARVIAAGIACAGVPGFLGLHLEGPHLDPRRAGAHDPALIRPMEEADCQALCAAARQLPALMVTVAPCAVTPGQISRLAQAGVIVSLGHAEASRAEAQAAFAAGARGATHLFNAMSPLGHREPGLPGAVLVGTASAGIIADGVHVAPEVLQIALAARPEGLFLVSDAMAVAGTDASEFLLNDRRVLRRGGRLVLENGTLAGADLSLPQAVAFLIRRLGIAPERALAMAGRVPAGLIGANAGDLAPGGPADLIYLDGDWTLQGVWQAGARVA